MVFLVNNIKNTTNNDFETIWIKILFLGDKGDYVFKSLKANCNAILLRKSSLELCSSLKD